VLSKYLTPHFICLSLLIACSSHPVNQQEAISPPTSAPTSSPASDPHAPPASTLTVAELNLQGNIFMPSGLIQAENGILMPSGILIPSGILLESGFQIASANSRQAFDQVPFMVSAYDLTTGDKIAETESNPQGQFVFKALPAGLELQLVATAQELPELELKALAQLPETPPEQALIRNISPETLAALLLVREAQEEADLKGLSGITVQTESDFIAPLQTVVNELQNKLGKQTVARISELALDAQQLRQHLRQIITANPPLRQPRRDRLQDPSFFPPDFRPEQWSHKTHLFPPPQPGQENPALPDGTCPPPPPGPEGQFIAPPEPLENGNCPPAKEPEAGGSLPPPPPPPGESPPPPPPPKPQP